MSTPHWLKELWTTEFLFRDFLIVVLGTAGFAAWVEWLGGREVIEQLLLNNRNNIYAALVSIFGSLLGFIITTMSIITTWTGRPQMEELRRKSLYPQLWLTFQSTIYAVAGAVFVAVFALVLDKDSTPRSWLWSLVLLGVLLAAIRTLRCVWLLRKLIDLVAGPLPAHDASPTPGSSAGESNDGSAG